MSTGQPDYYYSITYEMAFNEEKSIAVVDRLVDIQDIVNYTIGNLSHSTLYIIHVVTHDEFSNQDPNSIFRTNTIIIRNNFGKK